MIKIHFVHVEIISQVFFLNGKEKIKGMKVMTMVLIPEHKPGKPLITGEPFPEIYFQ